MWAMTRIRARALVGAALLATVGSGLVALPASAAGSGLYVELECVSAPLGDETTYLAQFRVLNPGTGTVAVPSGDDNRFSPDPADVGQPTSFNPGWTQFETTFAADGSAAWTLDGATVTATASSPACEYVYSGPFVIGTPAIGSTLTMAGERVALAVNGYNVIYQWWRDCDGTPEQVATGPQYVVQPSNVGERLGATITYQHGTHGIVLSSTCGPEATAGAVPASSAARSVVGTPKVGVPLSLSAATWAGTTPIAESVGWEVCDAATCVPAGSGPAYTPDADDVGKSVRAVVTGTNRFGSASATTAAVGPVIGPPGPAPAAAALRLSTARVDLGKVKVRTPGKARTVLISNRGGTSLVVRSVGVTGKHRRDVVVSTTCPGDTLAPGASCAVTLRLRPAAAGRRTAALVVTSTAPGGPARSALTGRGVKRR
jgi:hypothetical protein